VTNAKSFTTNPTQALAAFRRRADAFFGDTRARELTTATLAPNAMRAPATTKDALGSRLRDVLRRLDDETADEQLELRKSLTLHDGRVVAIGSAVTRRRSVPPRRCAS
jgi:hypothetical protein